MPQQRETETALTPPRAYAERTDPSRTTALGVAPKHGSNFVALTDDEPHGGIEVGDVDAPLGPHLERLRNEVPFFCKRLVQRSVKRALVAWLECRHLKAFRPLRLGRLGLVLDEHPIEAPYFAIPGALEERASMRVGHKTPRERRGITELAYALFAPAQ